MTSGCKRLKGLCCYIAFSVPVVLRIEVGGGGGEPKTG